VKLSVPAYVEPHAEVELPPDAQLPLPVVELPLEELSEPVKLLYPPDDFLGGAVRLYPVMQ
jgi:hypothetical protein|tara:strand:- start:218 stop:400 length:183 start_codon:yes stop_codon:yes gene_type:complete